MNSNQLTISEAWNRFWFEPSSTRAISALRILFGSCVTIYLLGFTLDITSWAAEGGLVPLETLQRFSSGQEYPFRFSLFYMSESPAVVLGLHFLFVACAIAATIGLFSRISMALTLVALLSYLHRLPMLTGLAESVLIMGTFYLCLAPIGSAFSIDALIRKRKQQRGSTPLHLAAKPQLKRSALANLAQRLIQLHVVFFYFVMFITQLNSDAWWQGEAVWTLGAATETSWIDFSRFGKSALLINLWSHEIVLFELAFIAFIWLRPIRSILVGLSVAHWLLLIPLLGDYQYSLAMIVASAAFLPDHYLDLRQWTKTESVSKSDAVAGKSETSSAKPGRRKTVAAK